MAIGGTVYAVRMDPVLDASGPGRILSIRLQNFKAHRDTTVPLGQLTVLVGPNGAGKTSVLEGLRALATRVDIAMGPILLGDQDRADVHHRGRSEPIAITATGTLQGTPWEFSLQFDKASAYRPEERATYGGQPRNVASVESRAWLEAAIGTTVLHQLERGAKSPPAPSLKRACRTSAPTAPTLRRCCLR